jgi:ABC-2 type transport system permease protein
MFRIAWKDIRHNFKSPFSLVMMFAAPLLITTLLYFAFGTAGGDSGGFDIPATRVLVVNRDDPPSASGGFAAGRMLVRFLSGEDLSGLVALSEVDSQAEALEALSRGGADVAVIIPADFTMSVLSGGRRSAIEVLHDPALSIGPRIVGGLVQHFVDGFAGSAIAMDVTRQQLESSGMDVSPGELQFVARQYAAWLEGEGHKEGGDPVRLETPSGKTAAGETGYSLVGPIMAGMLIFFIFFMGANVASSVIRESEEGTLARLRVSPAPLSAILFGKIWGVLLSLVVQAAVLLTASALLFRISWGRPLTLLLVMTGLVIAASGFGIMLMSFLTSTRQLGPVMGGVLTATGLIGGLFTTGIPQVPEAMEHFTLLVPPGWALQGLQRSLDSAAPLSVALNSAVLTVMGVAFVGVGLLIYRRRFSR